MTLETLFYKIVDFFLSNKVESEICTLLKTSKLFPAGSEITVFDVGSFAGNFTKNLRSELTAVFDGRQNFHLFDPNPEHGKKVKKNLDFKYQFHPIAIDSSNGVSDFFVNTNFPASGSSLQQIVANDNVWRKSRSILMGRRDRGFDRITVNTQTIDSFCSERSIKAVDILKIDVEGNELRVVSGATDMLKTCSVVVMEVLDKKSRFTKKMKSVEGLMAENGFLPLKIKKIWSVSLFSSLVAVDVIFVKTSLLVKDNTELIVREN